MNMNLDMCGMLKEKAADAELCNGKFNFAEL